MTKLVRKLKQGAKKRAHRRTVQKRKMERALKEIEKSEQSKNECVEMEVDVEMQRLAETEKDVASEDKAASVVTNKKLGRFLGGLVLDAPRKNAKKQMTRKQIKRREKLQDRGASVASRLEKKWNSKKRRVKQRAQIRNEDLHN